MASGYRMPIVLEGIWFLGQLPGTRSAVKMFNHLEPLLRGQYIQ